MQDFVHQQYQSASCFAQEFGFGGNELIATGVLVLREGNAGFTV